MKSIGRMWFESVKRHFCNVYSKMNKQWFLFVLMIIVLFLCLHLIFKCLEIFTICLNG